MSDLSPKAQEILELLQSGDLTKEGGVRRLKGLYAELEDPSEIYGVLKEHRLLRGANQARIEQLRAFLIAAGVPPEEIDSNE